MSRTRPSQVARRGNGGVADRKYQPIGAGVQDKAHLIGDWRATRCAIGGKLRFVQLDQSYRRFLVTA